MSEYFPKPNPLAGNVKVELDLPNYATKSDLKNATRVDTSNFANTFDLASLDIGKLETTPVDLVKLNDVVKNEAIEKTVYDVNSRTFYCKIKTSKFSN